MLSTFYHLTTEKAAKAILQSDGIEPTLSFGGRFAAWYCHRARIAMVARHITKRSDYPGGPLWVLAVYEDERWFMKLTAKDVYATQKVFYPYYADTLINFESFSPPITWRELIERPLEYGTVVDG